MPFTDPKDDENQLAPEIVLGARQFPNPEGLAPRMDIEGPPPTRFSGGAKLSAIPPAKLADQGDISSPPAADVRPEMMREASATTPATEGEALPSALQPSSTQLPTLFPEHTNTAEHRMNEIPAPINNAEGQTAHAAKTRLFDAAKEHLNSQLLKSPDEFANPIDYQRHLQGVRENLGAIDIAKANYELAHPWGSMESAHPGLGGKIGHAFGMIGNVAGQAFAPGLAQAIPGSRANILEQRAQGEAAIKEATAEQAQTAGAELKDVQGELAGEKAQTEETKRDLQQAQTGLAEAKTEAMEPKAENQAIHDLLTGNPDGGARINPLTGKPYTYAEAYGAVKGLGKAKDTKYQHVSGTLAGKPMMADFDPAKGEFTNPDTHEVIHGFQPQPNAVQAGPIVIDPSGKVGRATPGTTLAPGTQTPSGFAEMGRPTQMMRNTAQRAQQALQGIPEVRKELNDLKDDLGPVSGRWNEFMQGKVGMDKPEFAGLRADLLMLSSAVALAHAQGRLPENLRKEFDDAINAPKQDANNLISILDHMSPWLERAAATGQGPGSVPPAAGAKAAPKVGDIVKGHRFKGGNPADRTAWEKAQ
jgi:hypothetical protein